ncbi:MAG: hypothetical protein ACRD1L_04770 [Terriglobales bacterium]
MARKLSPIWAYLTVLLAALVGLAMTPLASAQDQSQSQATQQKEITATGCLQKAASGNGFQLTDSSTMKTYDLTAASSDVDLSAHVGHTVTVTGMPAAAPASSEANPPGSNPAGESQNQQLSVSNVKMVSSSCGGGGGGR